MTTANPAGLPDPFRRPEIRLRADVGTWVYGRSLSDGGTDIYLDVSSTDMLTLLHTIGQEGFEAFLHVIRHATPVPTNEGGIRLELHGFSGRWLRQECGFSERSAFRAVAALKDSGLVTVASMPGARGAEGKQRAIVTGLVGISDQTEDLVETRRGRGSRTSKRSTVPTNLQNRRTDGSSISTETQNRETFPQVSAVSTKTPKGPSKEEVGSPTSLSPSVQGLAPLGLHMDAAMPSRGADSASSATDGHQTIAPAGSDEEHSLIDAEPLPFSSASTWEELRDLLAQRETLRPGVLREALLPIVRSRSSAAGGMVKALGLQPAGQSVPVSDLATDLLVEVLTTHGGRTSRIWRLLAGAGVHLPDLPVDVLSPRLVFCVAAGLDAKKIDNWKGWIGAGLRKSSEAWTSSETIRRVSAAIDAMSNDPEDSEDPDGDEGVGTGPVAEQGVDAPAAVRDVTPSRAQRTEPGEGSARGTIDEAQGGLPHEVASRLDEAFAWVDPSSIYQRRGIEWVRDRPHHAKALVEQFLEAHR